MTHCIRTHQLSVKNAPVFVCEYLPGPSNQCAVLLNSATGLRQEFYQVFARYLNAMGYTVFIYDYRSVGKSRVLPPAEYDVSFTNWGQEDYPAVATLLFRLHPGKKTFLIGQSTRGNCIGLHEATDRFDGVITVGSHHGYLEHYPLWIQPYIFLKLGEHDAAAKLLARLYPKQDETYGRPSASPRSTEMGSHLLAPAVVAQQTAAGREFLPQHHLPHADAQFCR